jgi:hypothetical protein
MMGELRTMLLAAAVPATMLLAAPAQAIHIGSFVVDDFNFTAGQPAIPLAVDVAPADNLPATGSGNGLGSTIMNQLNGGGAWTRGFYAFLTAGDRVETDACVFCRQGHFSSTANSTGYGGFTYTGSTVNLNPYIGQNVYFDFATDLPNADVIMAFYNAGGLITTLHWTDLPSTGQALQRVAGLALPNLDFSAVTSVTFNIYGTGGLGGDPLFPTINLGNAAPALDFDVSDIPAPASLALLGIGMAAFGFGWRRRT